MADHICPKCASALEEGFVVDNTYGGRGVSNWAEGKPQPSFWTGVKLPSSRKIETWRCEGCGYLESYAP